MLKYSCQGVKFTNAASLGSAPLVEVCSLPEKFAHFFKVISDYIFEIQKQQFSKYFFDNFEVNDVPNRIFILEYQHGDPKSGAKILINMFNSINTQNDYGNNK